MRITALFRLTRCHKPAGTLLLWAPTASALWIANQGAVPLKLFFLFLLGTILMRAAGCVMNDIADRRIDLHVHRTRQRPLTAGEVSLLEALGLLVLLLFSAFLILLQLPTNCFTFALIAVAITIIYPFCKRFIQCPQLVLGLAFSLGIPMAFAASEALANPILYYLLIINAAWIVAYDTQYALVDKQDDLQIGVRSSAILFGSKNAAIIHGLQIFFHGLWLFVAMKLHFSYPFYLAWVIGGGILIYQHFLMKTQKESQYYRAFLSNTWYGLVLWIGVVFTGPSPWASPGPYCFVGS